MNLIVEYLVTSDKVMLIIVVKWVSNDDKYDNYTNSYDLQRIEFNFMNLILNIWSLMTKGDNNSGKWLSHDD